MDEFSKFFKKFFHNFSRIGLPHSGNISPMEEGTSLSENFPQRLFSSCKGSQGGCNTVR